MNDSSTGGILRPTADSPVNAYDDDLDDALQEMVVGITGLPGKMVRPRWQETPPKEPPINADWCAIGVTEFMPDSTSSIIHHGEDGGFDEMQRHERLTVLASFYGPRSRENAGLLRDGLYVSQNGEELRKRGLALYGVGNLVMAPDLVNMNWRRRADLQFNLSRQITRFYPVKNFDSVHGDFVSEDEPSQPFNVELQK